MFVTRVLAFAVFVESGTDEDNEKAGGTGVCVRGWVSSKKTVQN